MFKKILFFGLILICAATAVLAARDISGRETLKLYVTDAEMMRLIPIETHTNADTPSKQAKFVISRLIEGFDDNPKICRTIPKISGGMSVSVMDGTATVNIGKKMVNAHPDGREAERLTVYSIVNSLLSVDGIRCVRFTIDGRVTRDFIGYMDMRESFTKIETI